MTEDEMDDLQDLDAGGRRLMSMALAGTEASGLNSAGLLRRVRRQRTTRRRARALVPTGVIAALGGATAVAVTTLTVAGAPSALAAVTAAAAKTSVASFRIAATQTQANSLPSFGDGSPVRMTGVFALRRGLGSETVAGMPVRIIGGRIYVKVGAQMAQLYEHGKTRPWLEGRLTDSAASGLGISQGMNGDEPLSPAQLLGLLKSATSVTAEGPARGPGWTGTKYAFTAKLPIGPTVVRGTVYVDAQGRVRRLMTTQTNMLSSPLGGKDTVTETTDVTFGGFGVAVSVSLPPAGQVYNLGQATLYVDAGGNFAVIGVSVGKGL